MRKIDRPCFACGIINREVGDTLCYECRRKAKPFLSPFYKQHKKVKNYNKE